MPVAGGTHVIVISLICNALLAIGKGVTGILAHSNALVADAVHSMTDVSAFLINYRAYKRSELHVRAERRRSGTSNRYDIAKTEIWATYYTGILLFTIGLAICLHNGMILVLDKMEKPDTITVVVAFVALAAYVGLYRYSQRTGIERGERCRLTERNALWQNKMNVASGSVVVIGLTGSMFGFIFMDDLAAVAVGSILVAMGIQLSIEAGARLGTAVKRYSGPVVIGSILTSIAISAISLWIALS